MNAARIAGIVALLWAVLLVVCIAASSLEMGLGEGMRRLVDTRWGITTLVDLYAGLTFVAIWIGICERSWKKAAPWAVALALTGNLTTLVYLAWRCLRARTLREVFIPPAP